MMDKINIMIGKNIINSNTISEEKVEEKIEQERKESFWKRLFQIWKER